MKKTNLKKVGGEQNEKMKRKRRRETRKMS
jgi:hypothetical protein